MTRESESAATAVQRAGGRLSGELVWTVGLTVTMVAAAGFIPEFRALQFTSWAIYGLLALSLALVWGHGGIFSFGQGAFFGIGGYAYGISAINLSGMTGETFSAVIVAVIIATLAAAVLGYFMFYGKVGDVYVGIITLATSLVLFTFMSSTAGPRYRAGEALLGGYNGMAGVPPLSYGTPGTELTALSPGQLLAFTVILACIVTLAVRALLRGPFGRVLAGVRENELRTQLLGYDIRLRKLIVFAIGGAIAGLAGAQHAAWALFINPIVFGLQQAAVVVIWVLVGGRKSLPGAFLGVVLVEGLASFLGAGGGSATPIILGAVLIAVVILLPQGLVPALHAVAQRWIPWLRERPAEIPFDESANIQDVLTKTGGSRQTGVLEGVDLYKSFGGVMAVENVTLAFRDTGVHCLIGPNGAGKTTFFNLLVGRYRPTSGKVLFGGAPITGLEPHERVRRGLGIKLQVASIFPGLTTFENLWLAAYARLRVTAAATKRATQILDWLELRAQAGDAASTLSHGQKQWLEIGMVLGGEPTVMLLDEPTAGMTREETARTAAMITKLGKSISVVAVEHDMEFVRQVDVPVTVFHQGSVFARGSLEELRRDERILDIYLGRHRKAIA
jgi:branched-chain amino acid transport system permease protein